MHYRQTPRKSVNMTEEFGISEDNQKIHTFATEFAQKEIAPHVSVLESDFDARLKLFKNLALQGYMTLSVDHKLSNLHVDQLGYALVLTALAKADAGIAVTVAVTNMVAEALDLFGTPEQKSHWITLLRKGERVPTAFSLTEKQAGSDPKNLSTKATEDPQNPNVYVLNGEKQFVTNGDIAGFLIVMAKLNETKSSHGITAFIVEKGTPGLEISKTEKKLGLLTANLVDLTFKNCRIPKNQILGKPGEGLKIALSSLDSGRIGIAAQSIGIAEAALEAAIQHAKTRIQFGHPLADNQALAFKIADMHLQLSASKLLLLKAALKKEQKQRYTLEAAEAKLFCSEMCNALTYDALQMHGGYGYIKDLPLERYWRDARATTLYEGTSEIQRIVISRIVLGSEKTET